MHITIIGRHGTSRQTTIPREILKALKVGSGDYLYWIWNTKGHAEIRRVPRANELAAPEKSSIAAALRPVPTPSKPQRRR